MTNECMCMHGADDSLLSAVGDGFAMATMRVIWACNALAMKSERMSKIGEKSQRFSAVRKKNVVITLVTVFIR